MSGSLPVSRRTWIERLTLTDFRNHASVMAVCGPSSVVLLGENGAGKTNCLEAISMLTAGRGLRALPFSELARKGGGGGWTVSAHLHTGGEAMLVGTGISPPVDGDSALRSGRTVKIDGEAARPGTALANIGMLWLTPAMDGLFTGPASERRRFLDRFAMSLNPAHGKAASAFERAMRQRNKALEEFAPPAVLDAFECEMAAAGTAIAAGRVQANSTLNSGLRESGAQPWSPYFPQAEIVLRGDLEEDIDGGQPLEFVQNSYSCRLGSGRDRDRAARRTLSGPHRTDFEVTHLGKAMPARMCSTGEQKALLAGLVLAQTRVIRNHRNGVAPLLLLDEIAAHFDLDRRLALFAAVCDLDAQVWMTGTDLSAFEPMQNRHRTQFFCVSRRGFVPLEDAESASKH